MYVPDRKQNKQNNKDKFVEIEEVWNDFSLFNIEHEISKIIILSPFNKTHEESFL